MFGYITNKSMATDTQAGTKAPPGGCTSQEWSLNDSANFYTAMSAFTFFDDGKLVVNHAHFTDKEIEIINNVEFDNIINPPNAPYNSVDAESVWALTFQGVPMFRMSYVDMLSRLRTLQKAAGGYKSAKVINQKHRDSIEKFAFEFKSLNETGGFTGAAHTGVSGNVNQQPAMPLINIKNLDNIKALLRFIIHGNMFCRANNVNMPLQELTTQMKEILADFSEPEMWIWAMVRRHGMVMISYMNTCISNLAATFVNEKSKLDAEDLRYMIAKNRIPKGYLAKLLKRMLDAIYDLEDDSEPKPEPKPEPNLVKPINFLPEPSNDASSTISDSNFSEILEILSSPQLTSISSNASFTYPTPLLASKSFQSALVTPSTPLTPFTPFMPSTPAGHKKFPLPLILGSPRTSSAQGFHPNPRGLKRQKTTSSLLLRPSRISRPSLPSTSCFSVSSLYRAQSDLCLWKF